MEMPFPSSAHFLSYLINVYVCRYGDYMYVCPRVCGCGFAKASRRLPEANDGINRLYDCYNYRSQRTNL